MIKTTEQKIIVNSLEGTKIIRAEVKVQDDGSSAEICIVSEVIGELGNIEENMFQVLDYFPIVEASKLSLEDTFLMHEPESENQKRLRNSILEGIISGLSDFRHHTIDPLVDENENIYFEFGFRESQQGHHPKWWNEKAKRFLPSKNSRLGSPKEYDAFLGVLIKTLIEKEGYELSEAWKAVCDDSIKLGNYRNSKHIMRSDLERTGSKGIGKWCDLSTKRKIIKEEGSPNFYYVSGNCFELSYEYPLAKVEYIDFFKEIGSHGVGWIVLDV